MRKLTFVLMLSAAVSAQVAFAEDAHSKACATIAKACTKAGYSHKENATKDFWHGCMKPLILGQTVKNVTVDADTAKTCRTDRIEELKQELTDLQQAQN